MIMPSYSAMLKNAINKNYAFIFYNKQTKNLIIIISLIKPKVNCPISFMYISAKTIVIR